MIHVFCNKRGSGKTKALISMANDKLTEEKGHIVYVDADNKAMLQLHRDIRFVDAKEFDLLNTNHFYGFLCGMISEDYDIDTIYIDGLFNIVQGNGKDAAHLFFGIEKLSQKHNVEFYINVNSEDSEATAEVFEYIKKYVA